MVNDFGCVNREHTGTVNFHLGGRSFPQMKIIKNHASRDSHLHEGTGLDGRHRHDVNILRPDIAACLDIAVQAVVAISCMRDSTPRTEHRVGKTDGSVIHGYHAHSACFS
jgi:hypothetical protein